MPRQQLKTRSVLVLTLTAVIFTGAFLAINAQSEKSVSRLTLTYPLFDFAEPTFYQGVNRAKEEDGSFSAEIKGGVVPHHNLASYLIADFFFRLAKQSPEVVILLGPNHREVGSQRVLTSVFGWETPFGVLEVDKDLIDTLAEKKLVGVDDKSLENEQSIAALAPYIKYYLPEVKIVPIILKNSFDLGEIQSLGNIFAEILSKETVIVASVDFSHYLTSHEAQKKDEITLRAIKDFDFPKILSFKSDYLDSPPAIAVLLWVMKEKGETDIEVIHHTNSGELLNNDLMPTTSYFVLGFF